MVSETDFYIGVAFVLGFAILLSLLAKGKFFETFVSFCLIASVFIYKAGYIELWLVILFLFLDFFILAVQINNRTKGAT